MGGKSRNEPKPQEEAEKKYSDAIREDFHVTQDSSPRTRKEENPLPPFSEDKDPWDEEPSEDED